MAQKYYTTKEAADILGIASADVKQMQDRRELYGYRDGADWKFKAEDIDRIAQQRSAPPAEAADEQDEVLLSEVELGQPSAGASGTVIGMAGSQQQASDSDLQLAGSDIRLAEGGTPSSGPPTDDVDTKVTQFENLELGLDEGLSLEGSAVTSTSKPQQGAGDTAVTKVPEEPATGESSIDLSGKELEDDDLVLGGNSGTGSDITIGGDSGISLVDPADSGLSLEEPLTLIPAAEESLELGEDGLAPHPEAPVLAAPAGTGAVKTDDDFLLTPLEEAGAEDSESGSQVIALDTESDDSATIIASHVPGTMATMLDEDLGAAEPSLGLGAAAPLGDLGMGGAALATETLAMAAAAPMSEPAFALPEAPYKTMDIVLLGLCAFVLMFCGMFMFDLMRNMHYWDTAYSVNSAIMDLILGK